MGDNVKLSTLLDLFAEYAKLDNLFSLCEQKFLEMRRIARLLQQVSCAFECILFGIEILRLVLYH